MYLNNNEGNLSPQHQQAKVHNRFLWLQQPPTQEFLLDLDEKRKSLLNDAANLSVCVACSDEQLKIKLIQAKTIEMVLNYGRTGQYESN